MRCDAMQEMHVMQKFVLSFHVQALKVSNEQQWDDDKIY